MQIDNLDSYWRAHPLQMVKLGNYIKLGYNCWHEFKLIKTKVCSRHRSQMINNARIQCRESTWDACVCVCVLTKLEMLQSRILVTNLVWPLFPLQQLFQNKNPARKKSVQVGKFWRFIPQFILWLWLWLRARSVVSIIELLLLTWVQILQLSAAFQSVCVALSSSTDWLVTHVLYIAVSSTIFLE